MFDVSFTELIVIGVVALVILGPERLPKVARTVGHLLGRAQRYVNDVKSDIQREIELDELRKFKQQMDDAAQDVNQSLRQAGDSVRGDLEAAQRTLDETAAEAKRSIAPRPRTASLLRQAQGLRRCPKTRRSSPRPIRQRTPPRKPRPLQATRPPPSPERRPAAMQVTQREPGSPQARRRDAAGKLHVASGGAALAAAEGGWRRAGGLPGAVRLSGRLRHL
nr:Sec-independent protein translocase protein TatB [Bordetella trematum]